MNTHVCGKEEKVTANHEHGWNLSYIYIKVPPLCLFLADIWFLVDIPPHSCLTDTQV